jgi:hypothetical protein
MEDDNNNSRSIRVTCREKAAIFADCSAFCIMPWTACSIMDDDDDDAVVGDEFDTDSVVVGLVVTLDALAVMQ